MVYSIHVCVEVPVKLISALADSLDRLRSAKKCAGKTDFRTSFNACEQVYHDSPNPIINHITCVYPQELPLEVTSYCTK